MKHRQLKKNLMNTARALGQRIRDAAEGKAAEPRHFTPSGERLQVQHSRAFSAVWARYDYRYAVLLTMRGERRAYKGGR